MFQRNTVTAEERERETALKLKQRNVLCLEMQMAIEAILKINENIPMRNLSF